MKKFIYFILFMFLFICNVKALDIKLTNKVIEFDQVDGFELQGFTSTDKYIFMILTNDDDSLSNIKVFDINSYKLIKDIYGSSLGHANDVTYNSKENVIYIAISGGSDKLATFNGDDFSYMGSVDIDLPVRSISYIDKLDQYAVRMVSTGYLLDNDFNKVNNTPFVYGMNISKMIGRQGWTYYNDFIYYCNWSWIRMGGDGSNTILIYDLDGKFVNSYHTNTTVGEIEGISFSNDKMILGFNEYEGKVAFYIEDIIDVDYIKIDTDEDEVTVSDTINKEIKNDRKPFYIGFITGFITVGFLKTIQRKKKSK